MLRYRADIDGLRTVAVIPVVLFHAGVPHFSGGFVGVDVFFVISGYLITQVILGDMENDGFSIARFYERRIRRIFPALVVVLGFCLGVGYALQTPSDYSRMAKSAVAATFFVSNIFFWRSANYFESEPDREPLLHTWSLSVEEQFYIFYPLLLVLLTRFSVRKHVVFAALAVASLTLASVLVFSKQSATFYLLPTRAWELLIGGILALGVLPTAGRRATQAASLTGIAFIFLPVVVYTTTTRFPGLAAIPPTLGAGLLIWSGAGHSSFVHRLLASRPFTLIGQASYSLYLWHFPLLAFAAYAIGGDLPLAIALPVCLLSLIFSLISLAVIEKPFRSWQVKARIGGWIVAVPSMAMVAIAFLAVGVTRSGGFPSRLDATAQKYVQVQHDKDRHPIRCISLDRVIILPEAACHLGARDAAPSALLWGDSHAMVTATAMDFEAKRQGKAFLFSADADCPIGLGFSIVPSSDLTRAPSYRYCRDFNEAMVKKALSDPRIKAVVLSSRWTNWRIGEPANPAEANHDIRLATKRGSANSSIENRAIFIAGFERLLRELTDAGKLVYIVGPVPEPTFNVPHMLYLRHLGLGVASGNPTVKTYSARHQRILAIFSDVARRVPVRFIWPDELLCDHVICPIEQTGEPIYFDHNHLSIYGAHKTAPLYRTVFHDQ